MSAKLQISVDQLSGKLESHISIDFEETIDEVVYLCHVLASSEMAVKYGPTQSNPNRSPFNGKYSKEYKELVEKTVNEYAQERRRISNLSESSENTGAE